jgi:uncharacterized membrane protein
MCNHEEDFSGTAKYKHKYTLVDRYFIGIVLLGVTIAIAFMSLCLYQLILSL